MCDDEEKIDFFVFREAKAKMLAFAEGGAKFGEKRGGGFVIKPSGGVECL